MEVKFYEAELMRKELSPFERYVGLWKNGFLAACQPLWQRGTTPVARLRHVGCLYGVSGRSMLAAVFLGRRERS
jgi:hypothetical protein